jgi:hypothetical protein
MSKTWPPLRVRTLRSPLARMASKMEAVPKHRGSHFGSMPKGFLGVYMAPSEVQVEEI